MNLSELIDEIVSMGGDDDDILEVQDLLRREHPEIYALAYDHPMSSIPHDPDVPDSFAKRVLSLYWRRRAAKENPPVGIVTGADLAALKEKTVSIAPEKARERIARKIDKEAEKCGGVGFSIVYGNTKIGVIYNFSLPAGQNFRAGSCPGATELCESVCYAKDKLFSMNEWRYFVNWAYVLLWPDRFREVLSREKLSRVFRIHVGGDFFSADYVDLWRSILRDRRDIRFYAYTRSWQDGRGNVQPEFVEALSRLSKEPNMRLLLSCDRMTGVPPEDMIPSAMRAWLALDDNDLPPYESVGLIFRDHHGMRVTASEMAGAPVCPVERSKKFTKAAGTVTCRTCSWCWSTGHLIEGRKDDDPSQFDGWPECSAGSWIPSWKCRIRTKSTASAGRKSLDRGASAA
jgi:hypothetical protein